VIGRFRSVGNIRVESVGLRPVSLAAVQLKAFWTAAGGSPKPRLVSQVRTGQVKRPCCGSDVAAMLLEPARTVAAGWREPPQRLSGDKNARGWVTRERLFQHHGAEGQQPSFAALRCGAATVQVVHRLVVNTLHRSWQ